jgi:8-oxo-dGTP pyrophosphatase MutT (NUDIX family)
MKAEKISLDNAKKEKLFYFVANVVVYREEDGRCLILKRSDREKVHPGKYCVPGGKLDWNDLDINKPTRMNGDVYDFQDALEKLLLRETLEEAGVRLAGRPIYINSVAFIRPDETPVMMLKFAMKYEDGEIRLEQDAFSDFAWVNDDEVKNYDCIEGIPEEIKTAIEYFQK